jgi:hypothetical protein
MTNLGGHFHKVYQKGVVLLAMTTFLCFQYVKNLKVLKGAINFLPITQETLNSEL